MNYEFVLGIDPSGSFHEGKGTTGWSLLHVVDNKFIKQGAIKAKDFRSMEAYWDEVIKMISDCAREGKRRGRTIIVIEDYLLYGSKASSQINSRMETSKLIGVLQHYCHIHKLPYHMQPASLVKSRWTDDILAYKGYIRKKGTRWVDSEHTRDSMRHAVHYASFKNKQRD